MILPSIGKRDVILRFDGGDVTSDAGLALLAAADTKLGVTTALAHAFHDRRQVGKVAHKSEEIITARIFGIAMGYEDGNDFDRWRHDPGLKHVCGRLPASGEPLMSQETLSRFEHATSAKDLVRMGWALAELVIGQLDPKAERIWIDVDPYDDPCHGQQELSLFNGHYDTRCYLLLAVCITGSDGVQRLLGAVLRGGNAAAAGTVWASAQVGTLRTRLFKIGAKIVETCRKIWWSLPTSCPVQSDWRKIYDLLC